MYTSKQSKWSTMLFMLNFRECCFGMHRFLLQGNGYWINWWLLILRCYIMFLKGIFNDLNFSFNEAYYTGAQCTFICNIYIYTLLKRCVVQHFWCHFLRHACKTNDLLFKRNIEIERFKSNRNCCHSFIWGIQLNFEHLTFYCINNQQGRIGYTKAHLAIWLKGTRI